MELIITDGRVGHRFKFTFVSPADKSDGWSDDLEEMDMVQTGNGIVPADRKKITLPVGSNVQVEVQIPS